MPTPYKHLPACIFANRNQENTYRIEQKCRASKVMPRHYIFVHSAQKVYLMPCNKYLMPCNIYLKPCNIYLKA